MSWLEERKRKKKRREERRGESDHYVTDAGNQRHRGRDPWKKKKKKTRRDITSLPHWINNSSITSALPRQHCINTMATFNRSVSGELLGEEKLEKMGEKWGRGWGRWGGDGRTEAAAEGERGTRGRMMATLWTTDQWPGIVDGGCPGAWVEGRLTRSDEGLLTHKLEASGSRHGIAHRLYASLTPEWVQVSASRNHPESTHIHSEPANQATGCRAN